MKNTIVTILTIICLILGVTLLIQHTQARKQLTAVKAENMALSGDITSARAKADEREKVIAQLETNLTQRKEELTSKTGELEKAAAELAKVQSDYKLAQVEVQ